MMAMRAIVAETFSGYGGLRQIDSPKPERASGRLAKSSWPDDRHGDPCYARPRIE
jgi:hypothetical protein